MNEIITKEDVIAVIKSFIDVNDGDEATEAVILRIGGELLDISSDKMLEMLGDVVEDFNQRDLIDE